MVNQCLKIIICLSTGILLIGCLSMPPTHFYVLESLCKQAKVTGIEQKRQIGVGPVSIPALLERKQMVTRLPDNSLTIAEFHQWASPLKDNVAQVLTYNLAALQPRDLIRTYPWSTYGMLDYRIIIDVTRFDTYPEKSVNFEANWSIMNEKTHALISNGRSRIEHPLTDSSYPSVIKEFNKVLDEFSRELSDAVEKLK